MGNMTGKEILQELRKLIQELEGSTPPESQQTNSKLRDTIDSNTIRVKRLIKKKR